MAGEKKKKKIVIYSILFLELNVQIFVNDSRMETLWRIFISEIKRIPQSTYVRNSGTPNSDINTEKILFLIVNAFNFFLRQ